MATEAKVSGWLAGYVRKLALGDVACAAVAGSAGLVVRFGLPDSHAGVQQAAAYLGFSLPLIWPVVMLLARTYDQRFLWTGAEEFRRVFSAALSLVAGLGTVSWALKLEVARGFVVVCLPLVTLLTLAHRFVQRRCLRRRQRQGKCTLSILLLGQPQRIQALHAQINRRRDRGYRVIGWCAPAAADARMARAVEGLPLLGGADDLPELVRRHRIDAVAAASSPDLTGQRLRDLSWALEETAATLFLAPALAEVAGPRLRIRPAFGMPMMQVDRAELHGHRRVLKGVFDRSVAAAILLAFAPVILAITVLIKATSRGPVFFRHERIGRHGEPFHVLKFRTMYDGAHKRFDSLLEQSDGNAVQFKMRRDPRVTPIGRILRRFSVDELPQLFNVLGGSMSLVGPRPHIRREVEQYGHDMRRRLLVKPGMTGLWQVSGRSDLSWEDSVRVDVRYVEHWSLSFDLTILLKTVGAVLKGSGAY